VNQPDGATVFKQMAEGRIGSMLTTVLPFGFSSGPLPGPFSAPALGAHSDDVLRDWLTLPDTEIQTLKAQGALA
jgi:crotonobetainyl-CoA:carnitine CoA-transferase CaiB-like acyl-CoA transferase